MVAMRSRATLSSCPPTSLFSETVIRFSTSQCGAKMGHGMMMRIDRPVMMLLRFALCSSSPSLSCLPRCLLQDMPNHCINNAHRRLLPLTPLC